MDSSVLRRVDTSIARWRTRCSRAGRGWKCTVCNGGSLLPIALLLLHQCALHTTQILCGCIYQFFRLIRVSERLKHGSHLGFGLDMRACTAVTKMRQAAETTVLDTCSFQLTCTLRMLLEACGTNAITV
jgi:hypothetical protein